MTADQGILEAAIARVKRERSDLQAERCAFERFREAVRLATPDSGDSDDPSETTDRLLTAYQEAMEELDYEEIYGDTIAESLQEEFSPAIADVLLSDGPLTQRRKRDLLLTTTGAIQRREKFLEELADERETLQRFGDDLADVESTVQALPSAIRGSYRWKNYSRSGRPTTTRNGSARDCWKRANANSVTRSEASSYSARDTLSTSTSMVTRMPPTPFFRR
jgi:hypothetical protein